MNSGLPSLAGLSGGERIGLERPRPALSGAAQSETKDRAGRCHSIPGCKDPGRVRLAERRREVQWRQSGELLCSIASPPFCTLRPTSRSCLYAHDDVRGARYAALLPELSSCRQYAASTAGSPLQRLSADLRERRSRILRTGRLPSLLRFPVHLLSIQPLRARALSSTRLMVSAVASIHGNALESPRQRFASVSYHR